jgi:selenocysteine lyase/cysteine desulfurase
VRFSFAHVNTKEELAEAVEALKSIVQVCGGEKDD